MLVVYAVYKLLVYIQLITVLSLFSVWADNADMISLQYAGTGALKTDFTRYAYIAQDK